MGSAFDNFLEAVSSGQAGASYSSSPTFDSGGGVSGRTETFTPASSSPSGSSGSSGSGPIAWNPPLNIDPSTLTFTPVESGGGGGSDPYTAAEGVEYLSPEQVYAIEANYVRNELLAPLEEQYGISRDQLFAYYQQGYEVAEIRRALEAQLTTSPALNQDLMTSTPNIPYEEGVKDTESWFSDVGGSLGTTAKNPLVWVIAAVIFIFFLMLGGERK